MEERGRRGGEGSRMAGERGGEGSGECKGEGIGGEALFFLILNFFESLFSMKLPCPSLSELSPPLEAEASLPL